MKPTLEDDLEQVADDKPHASPDEPTVELHAVRKARQAGRKTTTVEPEPATTRNASDRKPVRDYTPVPYQTYTGVTRMLDITTAILVFCATTVLAAAPVFWQAALMLLVIATAIASYSRIIIPMEERSNMRKAVEHAYGIIILSISRHDRNRHDLHCLIPNDRRVYEATLFHTDGRAWLCTGTDGTIVGRIDRPAIRQAKEAAR